MHLAATGMSGLYIKSSSKTYVLIYHTSDSNLEINDYFAQ